MTLLISVGSEKCYTTKKNSKNIIRIQFSFIYFENNKLF